MLKAHPIMHLAVQLLAFWAIAFLTLCTALVLLNAFYGLIGGDFELCSFGKEAAIAGTASLVEGASVWLIISFIPAVGRALIIPILIVGFIYKLSHLEDWRAGDVILLLVFQAVVFSVGVSLLFGYFKVAIIISAGFAAALAIFAGFAKSFGD